MRLFFSGFPGGLPGLALLLLRAVLGIAIVVHAGWFVRGPGTSPVSWLLGLSGLASGCMLLIGFLTPLASLIVGLDVIGISLSDLPFNGIATFDSWLALIFGLTILIALVGTGPGRFSVDARVFGQREIIIPLPDSSLKR